MMFGDACPDGCDESSCVQAATGPGLRCSKCKNGLVMDKITGFCACPAGQYGDPAGVTCIDCPKGSWCAGGTFTLQGTPVAEQCPASMTTVGKRAASSRACVNLPGFKYTVDAMGEPNVEPCPEDSYNGGLRRQRSCYPCPVGYTTNGLIGRTDISQCVVPPGYYMPLPTIIAPCPVGTYKEAVGPASSCSPCSTGVTTVGDGSASRTACSLLSPGYYAASLSGSTITAASCLAKHYCSGGQPKGPFNLSSPDASDATIRACPDGMWTNSTGAKTIADCLTPPGFYTVPGSGSTLKCPSCSYRAGWAAAGGAAACHTCGTGVFAVTDTHVEELNPRNGSVSVIAVTTLSSSCYIKAGTGMYYQAGVGTYRARNCVNDNWGVNTTTYGLALRNCQACPLDMVTSTNSTSYPTSSSYYVDNGDGTGGFISPLACVTRPGYGVYGTRSLPCPKGEYNRQDTYSNCTACPAPLTTAGPGAGVTINDCGIPAGYGYHSGSVVLCPIGTYNDANITYSLTMPCTACPAGQTTAATGTTSLNGCYDVTCGSVPTAPLTFGPGEWGSWPPGCAGRTYGQLCAATCSYGGSATVNCMADTQWNSTVTGGCAAPTNCSAVPGAALSNGSWPAACAGSAIGAQCSANCTWGGAASVECTASGDWDTAVTGACADPPTNCSSVPTAPLTDGSWPSNCAGAAFGATCTASCAWGGTATVTCNSPAGNWDAAATGSCSGPPSSCSSAPTAPLSYGSWPPGCAGASINAQCYATCTYGGTAYVSCNPDGQWDVLVTGSCSSPSSCSAVPTAPLSHGGSWPGGCAGMAIGATCTAECPFGGTATVTCQATGNWQGTATGGCDAPTNCTYTPTTSVSNGAWPNSCAGASFGATCAATCTWGGSASVQCLSTGFWSTPATGSCNDPPPTCSGLPANPPYGTWPSSCAGIVANQTCTATCSYGGSATVGCQANGSWNSTVVGSCTPGGTAFISETGLGIDRLRVCNLSLTAFSGCQSFSGFGASGLRSAYAEGNTVWVADASGSGTFLICAVNQATNALSGCSSSSIAGFNGVQVPVGLVIKSGTAYIANDGGSCGIIQCSSAADLSGCSCALTNAQGAKDVRGIALSPDGNTLYFTSQTSGGSNYGIVACAMSGTSIGTCTTYNSATVLTGVFVTGSKLYVVARYFLLVNYARVWVCDPAAPDPATCIQTGDVFATGLMPDEPWGVSVFDGALYVTNNDGIKVCNPNTAGSCSNTGLNLAPLLQGASSLFVLPRI